MQSQGVSKITVDRFYKILQNTFSAGMTCHLVSKAVMQQNCIKTLNQHKQLLEKKAAFSDLT